MVGQIVLNKEIDYSSLTDGMTLPHDNETIFASDLGITLERGEKREITLLVNGLSFQVTVINVNNPRSARKRDVFQIRYSRTSPFAKYLQQVFHCSWDFFCLVRKEREENDRSIIRTPDQMKEFLVLYSTNQENVFVADTIVRNGIEEMKSFCGGFEENVLEPLLVSEETDPTSSIQNSNTFQKYRKLEKGISDRLKELYSYRCQICGERIGAPYSTHIAEAHHIEYFSKSWNNDSSNQLILCPNHHRIIHKLDPSFAWNNLSFHYPNGLVEKLVLNFHLHQSREVQL